MTNPTIAVPRELLERLEHVTRNLAPHLKCHADLTALLTAQPQASAAQSAPAGEREAEAAAIAEEIDWLIRQWDAGVNWSGERMAELLEAAGKAAEMLAAWQRTQAAGVPEGWKLVPVEPTEEMWSGLARHLMMWLDFGNPTVEALRKHLDMLNIEWPAWMDAESELRGSGVPSKGTRATLIYKAMLAAAPAQPAAQDQGEVQRLREALEWAVDRWHAEVASRPLVNVHRRALDDTWRQIIRRLGGDAGLLCGPAHDELLALAASTGQEVNS